MLSDHPAATVAICQRFLRRWGSGQQIPALLQLIRPQGRSSSLPLSSLLPVERSALSSSPDSGATQSDTHSLRYTAWPPPPPLPISATLERSPTRHLPTPPFFDHQ
ncbi:unnamed protein product [Pleuronectes platessa]|uniref:Uncharacterized protein n=1 Tax=Pleuronectes platessa TaxID=8262 RepID=A0A9N7W0V1_PLEPL|nr:unnamed protein product [Pleuronectes platessa]